MTQTQGFIAGSLTFIKDNILDITIVALLLLSIYIVYVVHEPTHIHRIEALENINKNSKSSFNDIKSKAFCDKYKGETHNLDIHCNKLNKNTCSHTDCCVYLVSKEKGNRCVAGGINGPTYHTDENGKDINFDYYYYKNKEYGK